MKFINTYPEKSVMTGALREQNQKDFTRRQSAMFLRPTNDGQFYRFRLLNFPPSDTFMREHKLDHYRDYPFILRHVHTVFHRVPDEKAPNGVRTTAKTIPCPQTDYIRENSNLTRNACPICSAGNLAWNAYRDSNNHNQAAKEKGNACRTTFEVLVPVYIVTDPNYEANNGQVKVLIINKDQYEKLDAAIRVASQSGTPWCNDKAVDFFCSYGKVEKSYKTKSGETRTYTSYDFTRCGFTTNAYKIETDLDAQVEDLKFDENWFIIPTLGELQEFYSENIATPVSVPDDIPSDIPLEPAPKPVAPKVKEPETFDAAVKPAPKPAPKPVAQQPEIKPSPVTDIPAVDVPSPEPEVVPQPSSAMQDKDIDSFIKGLNIPNL